MGPVVIVPAYQPDPRLVGLVTALVDDPGQHVIVVDDGSSKEHEPTFNKLAELPRVHLVRHAVNMGKGQALKTAFNHFLTTFDADCAGVVTADADGQHLLDDIRKVRAALERDPAALCLGTRNLRQKIPWKSKVGNTLTRLVFRVLIGRALEDTQTGLRGVPRSFLPELLGVRSSGYEFELDMLVLAVRRRMVIHELPISTVYEDNNRSSHFHPIRDSLKVYFVFLRFLTLSLVTAGLDLVAFTVTYMGSSNILASTAAARVVAGTFNFYVARRLVFRSRGAPQTEFLKYVLLVVCLMAVSYGLLTGLVVFLGLGVFVAKIVAETTLFVASFAVQRVLVFTGHGGSAAPQQPTTTDWDAYYDAPIPTARLTRRYTEGQLLDLIQEHVRIENPELCELGGANSCFFDGLRRAFPGSRYLAVDTNARGLGALARRTEGDPLVRTLQQDARTLPAGLVQADVVFSVGLIEHFTPDDTARIVRKHFDCVKPGGLVIITFPTPTWLYRSTRLLAECAGLWRFPDERPLSFEEVLASAAAGREVLARRTLWPLVLTQGLVAVRA